MNQKDRNIIKDKLTLDLAEITLESMIEFMEDWVNIAVDWMRDGKMETLKASDRRGRAHNLGVEKACQRLKKFKEYTIFKLEEAEGEARKNAE